MDCGLCRWSKCSIGFWSTNSVILRNGHRRIRVHWKRDPSVSKRLRLANCRGRGRRRTLGAKWYPYLHTLVTSGALPLLKAPYSPPRARQRQGELSFSRRFGAERGRHPPLLCSPSGHVRRDTARPANAAIKTSRVQHLGDYVLHACFLKRSHAYPRPRSAACQQGTQMTLC